MKKSGILWKIVFFALIAGVLAFIEPFLSGLYHTKPALLLNNENDFTVTLIRTGLYALLSTIALVVFGFFGAYALRNVPFFSTAGKNLGLLILPVTLGNICIAFACKLLIGDTAFFSAIIDQGNFFRLGFLIWLQLWQFGLLFVYLFWMNFQGISPGMRQYSAACKFSKGQELIDIYLPHSKNLTVLLICSGFVFSLFEESKIHYLYKASQGTDSELVTNWLTRNYQSSLLADPGLARQVAFNAGSLTFLAAAVTLVLIFIATLGAFGYFSRLRFLKYKPMSARPGIIGTRLRAALFAVSVLIPLGLTLSRLRFSFDSTLSMLVYPAGMTVLAAGLSTLTAIVFGLSGRLGWKKRLQSFSRKSLLFFILLFAILLVPPLVIMICGYQWMAALGYRSELVIDLIWLAGHTILTLPVLGSFILFNHFSVKNNELDYLEVYKLKRREVIRYSFIGRFKANYLLLFLVSFSLIWNEANLNSLFSDYIPSFAAGLKMLITGRAADYTQASGYLLVSLLLGLMAVATWRYILNKIQQIQQPNEAH
jgi:hypothetical protein